MHDIRLIRDNPDAFDAALARRGMPARSPAIVGIDQRRRAAATAAQEGLAARNAISKRIGEAKRRGEDTAAIEAEATALRERIAAAEAEERAAAEALDGVLATLPNLLDASVPDGPDETANVVLATHGEPRKFNFEPRQHFDIGEGLGLMDFASAAKLAGARFTLLRGDLARLERALAGFMLDLHTRTHGYTEMSPPLLVNDATVYGTGQLPKFADDLFRTTDGRWLIPTAEVPLTNLVRDEIVPEAALPYRFTALTPCFRSEAGSAGRDTRGMLRQHQFSKVELVSITTPEQSDAEHERMTQAAEAVLAALGLAFRRVVLSAGDTGFAAAKTYDLEVWLPGQGAWREISSCSNCRDFQARRMNARFRPQAETDGRRGGTRFVHTLNGSGVAVGRALIAVLETFQQEDGSVALPPVLHPYMGGVAALVPPPRA
jgi:seryl-tRNA synthetase